MDTNYKPNSKKYKAEQANKAAEKKEVKKVVSGKVKTKKKSILKENLISEDARNVKSYVIFDVFIPAVKKAISDIVTNGIDMILYGETGRSKKSSSSTYVSYDKKYRDDRFTHSRSVQSYNYEEIILDTRGEAEEVLVRMDELIDTYGVVSVGDMCDLCGVSYPYTANKYGWTNIRNAEVIHVRDGYLIKMPKALPID